MEVSLKPIGTDDDDAAGCMPPHTDTEIPQNDSTRAEVHLGVAREVWRVWLDQDLRHS
jgi:hypothetical protein